MMEVMRQNQLQIMSDSFEKLYDNGTLTDIKIKCKDGGFVLAHKSILISLSETFHALIVGANPPPPCLDFPNIRHPVLKIIIRFIYCGQVVPELPDNIELVKEVLKASFFFRLTTLFDFCKKIILGYLQNESVIQLWSVLEPFKQEDGEAEVANFILGHLEEVSCTKDFSQLSKQQMHKLADYVDKNQFNDDFVKFCVDWANSDPSYTSARLPELSILIRKIGLDTVSDNLLQKLFDEPWILQLPELSTLAIGRIMKMRNNPKMTNIHFYSLNSKQAQTFNNDVKKWNKMINRPESMDIFNSKSASICSGGKFIYRKFPTKNSDAVLRYDTAANEADKIFTKIELKPGPIVGFGTNIYMWSPTEFVRCDPENQTVTKLANLFYNFDPVNQGKAFLRAARDELFLRFENHQAIYSYNIQKNEWNCKTNLEALKRCTSDSFCCGKWYFFFYPSEESAVIIYDPQCNKWKTELFPEGKNKRLIGQSLDLPFLIFQAEANENQEGTSDESSAIWLYYAEKSGRKWEKLPNGLVLDGRSLRCDVTVG